MSPSLVRRCTIIRPVLRPITLAILLALSASPLTTHAALYTWTGAAGGNLWGTNGNWQSNQGNAVPSLNGLTDTDLFFGDRNTVSLNLGNAYGIRSLNFDVDARAYTFNGGSLTLGSGGLTHNAATAQSFNTTPVLLGADQTWTLASGAGALSFNAGVDTSGRALTINAATTTGSGNVINGAISGSGSLTKTGAGILTLSGANTYTGNTTVSSGTLAIAGSVSSGANSTLTVSGNAAALHLSGSASSLSTGTLVIGDTRSGTFNQDGGSLTTNGQTLYLGYLFNSSGTYNLSGGSLSTSDAYVGSSGNGTFNQSGGSFTTNGSILYLGYRPLGVSNAGGIYNLSGGSLTTGLTQVGDNAGASVFTQTGGTHTTGTLVLTGSATTSRGIYNLNGGTLLAGNVTSGDLGVSGTSTFNFNGGTLQASAASTRFLQGLTTANVQAGGARVDTASYNVTIAQDLVHDTAAGAMAADGGLTKLGAGTLTLAGNNTHTGGTTFAGGVLNAGSTGALGSTGTLTFSGGTLQYSAANQTDYSARFSTADGQAYNIDTNGQNVTLASGLAGAGGSLSKSGAGTLTLAGANTYTGNTAVHGGTLAIAGTVSSGSGSNLLMDNNAAINLSGSASSLSTGAVYIGRATFNQSGGGITTGSFRMGFQAGGIYNLSGGSLSTGDAYIGFGYDTNSSFNQSGGNFTTNGNALYLGLSYSSSGTYNLSGGSLTTSRTQVSASADTSVFTQSGGTHTTDMLGLTGYSTASQGIYNLNGGTLLAGIVTSGALGVSGTSTFNFNGGTLQASAASTRFLQGLTTANVQAGGARVDTAGFDITVAQALLHDTSSGAAPTDGGLTKLGAGTLTLTGANTFNGALNIAAGTLAVAAESILGARNAVTVGGGGTLLFTGNATLARVYNLGVSTLATGSGNTLTFGNGAVVNGGFLGAGGTLAFGNGSTLQGSTAALGSRLTTAGTVSFANTTLNGGTAVAAGSTLVMTNVVVSNAGLMTINGRVNANGVLDNGVTTVNSGGVLASTAPIVFGGGSRTTVNAGGLLSAADGSSIELNGSQLINNGTQTGVLDINYGSLAKGSGSFGTVNIADGGKFSPGNSPGTATAQNFTFGAGGRYDFELNTASPIFATNSDLLKVTDTLFITAGTTPNSVFTIAIDSLNQGNQAAALSDFNSSLSYHYLLVDANSISGFDSSKFIVDTSGFYNNLNGGSFSISQSGNDLYLDFTPTTVTAVPEPATWAMWLAALTMGVGLQQRRRKQG